MSEYANTQPLLKLALRRDRIQLSVWLYGTAALAYSAASSVGKTYADEAARAGAVKLLTDNPALLLTRGAPVGTSEGALAMVQVLTFLCVLAGLMSTFAVVRHTRQNEESGRAELVGAAPVGRQAGLAAALLLALQANVGLFIFLGIVLPLAGLSIGSSLVAAAAVAATGLAFAGVAAVTAQLSGTSRGANSLAGGFIAVAFLIRGVADAGGEVTASGTVVESTWLSWLSPIGWAQRTSPFGEDSWWVLAVPLLFAAATATVALRLSARRDLGAGVFEDRPGPASAAPGLLGPYGLARRLHRGSLIGWAVGIAVLGAVIGGMGKSAGDALKDNADLTETLGKIGGGGGAPVDTFFASMMVMVGAITAGFVVQALLRLRAEETSGRLEALLATAIGRGRWVAGHVAVAVAGSLVLLLVAGLAAGLTYGAAEGDVGAGVADLTGAALVQAPAVLVLAGVVVLVFGLAPAASSAAAWGALALCLVVGQLGALLKLPQAVRDLSPFSHLPALPAVDAEALPLVLLTAVAVLLLWAGTALFGRRDLAA
ncbi:anibiotic ABC transporter [Streptomyces sp. WAC07061]|uniref:ABC transporter permease n=1 Tax=Streptomyces sp. WAC07061 TaxID=2487410 RepID=UPI000F7A475A|nr:anibiotic ABC transporter [Streptomyces sp. WAC07061]RSS49728.1 anibiotic ABC transporter [Streptomyces sp. WAC07061]